jgi:acetoin utilization protein AcuB
MTENPFVVALDTPLIEAYTLMFEREIRRLPVVRNKKLVGIVTQSDIQRTLPGMVGEATNDAQLDAITHTVGDIMTTDPVTVAPEDTIQDVAEQMLENQVSGLPVVQNDRVVGIITESDIFEFIVSSWSE